jgi:hypothetical protein
LTKPFRPQTNGLVEPFNPRLAEAIARQPKRGTACRLFASHADRDNFLLGFVHNYNRTRLKCLGYLAPYEILALATRAKEEGHDMLAYLLEMAMIEVDTLNGSVKTIIMPKGISSH